MDIDQLNQINPLDHVKASVSQPGSFAYGVGSIRGMAQSEVVALMHVNMELDRMKEQALTRIGKAPMKFSLTNPEDN